MSKPARGTKRVCPSCGARFYDLGRSPITCPVCQAVYQVNPPSSSRRSERAAPVEKPKPAAEEPVSPVAGAEVISLDEAEEAEEAAVEDEEIVDLGDDDEDIPSSDDDDDTFLEEDEEGNDDVSGIVKGGAEEDT
jgi:uncharacterized protein (TIGR02300 family)